MMRVRRRTGVLAAVAAASAASTASLAACSSAGPAPGWGKAQDGRLRLAVPSGWDKTVPQSSNEEIGRASCRERV